MIDIIKKSLRIPFWSVVITILFFSYLFYADTGLKILVGLAKHFMPGTLNIEQIDGYLAGDIQLHQFQYQNKTVDIKIDDATISWNPFGFLFHHLTIERINAQNIQVNYHETSEKSDHLFHMPSLPYVLSFNNIAIQHLRIQRDHHAALQLKQFQLKATINQRETTALANWQGLDVSINKQSAINSGTGKLTLNGTPENYSFALNSDTIQRNVTLHALELTGHGQEDHIELQHYAIDLLNGHLAGSADIKFNPSLKVDVALNAQKIHLAKVHPGLPDNLSFDAQSQIVEDQEHYHNHTIIQHIDGSMRSEKISGLLTFATFDQSLSSLDMDLHLGKAIANIHFHDDHLLQANWHISIPDLAVMNVLLNGSLASDGELKGNTQHINFQLQTRDNSLALNLSGNYHDPIWSAVPTGVVHYTLLDTKKTAQITGGKITIKNDTAGLNSDLQLNFSDGDTAHAILELPEYHGWQLPSANQRIKGNLQVHSSHLQILPMFVSSLQNYVGDTDLQFSVDGKFSAPNYTGAIILKNGIADITDLGLKLTNIQIHSQLVPNGNFTLTATANSGKGELQISGGGSLKNGLFSRLNISGQNILAVNNEDAMILANPKLVLVTQNNESHLSGEVYITQAQLHPQNFEGASLAMSDVVLVKDGKRVDEHQSEFNFYSQVKLILSDQIYLKYDGIDAQITGTLSINDSPDTQTKAVGNLTAIKGKYTAYGQELKLKQGRLIFNGGPITDPGIDVQAIKTIDTIGSGTNFDLTQYSFNSPSSLVLSQTPTLVLGANVQHTLKQPVITFFSIPSGLSQADILSYLLVGKPLNSANNTERQSLYAAASSLNLTGVGGIGTITNELKAAFNLSELNIESENDIGTNAQVVENTALVLGKYFTPRLYVNYSIGLLQPINTFRARYSLTKHWVIQAQTNNSNGNGIDLFYSFER
jgi:translocation and assembly module TamB